MSNKVEKNFNAALQNILKYGDRVTSNGVILECTGRKYFDFVLIFLKFSQRPISEGGGIG